MVLLAGLCEASSFGLSKDIILPPPIMCLVELSKLICGLPGRLSHGYADDERFTYLKTAGDFNILHAKSLKTYLLAVKSIPQNLGASAGCVATPVVRVCPSSHDGRPSRKSRYRA